jgi:hypothetical protein
MLAGDDLTIQLFIGATAVAVLGMAVTQAGWTHKWFVRSLFVLAGILALSAIFWKPISKEFPKFGSFASSLASQSISWFTLLIVGFGIVFLLDLAARVGWLGVQSPVLARRPEPVITPKREPKSDEGIEEKEREEKKRAEPEAPRVFIDVTPTFLMGLYENTTAVKADAMFLAYIGKWIRCSGIVREVSKYFDDTTSVLLWDDASSVQGAKLIGAGFDRSWKERVIDLPQVEHLSIIGEIKKSNSYNCSLEHCEIVGLVVPKS